MPIHLSIILFSTHGGGALTTWLERHCPEQLKETEILIVGDNADEGVAQAVRPFIEAGCNISLIDGDANRARGQIGIRFARGEYVAFVDDDATTPFSNPSRMTTICKSTQSDIVVWNETECTPRGREHRTPEVPPPNVEPMQHQVFTGAAVMRKALSKLTAPVAIDLEYRNKLFRRGLLLKHGDDFPRLNQPDHWMPLVLMGLAKRVCVVNDMSKSLQPPLKKGGTGRLTGPVKSPDHCFTTPTKAGRGMKMPPFPVSQSDLIPGIRHIKTVLEKHGLVEANEMLFVRYFGDVLFNQPLRSLFAESPPTPDACTLAQDWIEKIIADSISRRLFLRYMALPEKKDERLCWATVRNRCAPTILNPQHGKLNNTRRQGGRELTAPSRFGVSDTVTIVTIVKDTLRTGRRHHFEKMLASVAAQDYGKKRLTHIVIDGASTDGTVDYLDDLGNAGVVDYWLSESDGGIYHAMNKGAAFASGEYVLYLNSDDFLAADAISRLVAAIKTENADYAYANAGFIDENGQIVGTQIGNMNTVFFGSPYCHQTLLCKTRCFDKVQYDESFEITMWKYAIDLFLSDFRSVYSNHELAYFRVGGVSTGEASRMHFFQEQEIIRRNIILPRLNLSYEEYDYIDCAFRGRDIRRFSHIDAKKLCDRLKAMGDVPDRFAKAFGACALRLVTCAVDDASGHQVLQSLLND